MFSEEKEEEIFFRRRERKKIVSKRISFQEIENGKGNIFGEMNIGNRALNLAYFEMIGDAAGLNSEIDRYRSVTADNIRETAASIFREENSSVIYYLKNN